MFKAPTSEVDDLNATLILVLQQDILRFEIAMHDAMLFEKHETLQHLDGEAPH